MHASLYQDGAENSTDDSVEFSIEEEAASGNGCHGLKLEPTSVKKARPESQSTMPTTLHKQRGSSSMALSGPKEEVEPVNSLVLSAREQTNTQNQIVSVLDGVKLPLPILPV